MPGTNIVTCEHRIVPQECPYCELKRLRGQLDELSRLLFLAAPEFCSNRCPSVFRKPPAPHVDDYLAMRSAIANLGGAMKKPKVRTALDAIADTVLAYRTVARSKPAVQRKRRKTILEKKRATGKEK